jgi:hypothetical protein
MSTGSVEPSVWRWPPHYEDVVLQCGFKTVNIKVASVEPPLVSKRIVLLVRPPLSFNATTPNVSWLVVVPVANRRAY